MTEAFSADLDSRMLGGILAVPFFQTLTNVFQLKIHWAEVQSWFVHVRYVYFL
jgi:hypothetical protein